MMRNYLLLVRDEPGSCKTQVAHLLAVQAHLFKEFLAREREAGRLALPLGVLNEHALRYGHHHQKV